MTGTKMRKGISLLEMLGVLLIMSLVTTAMLKPVQTLTAEIPRIDRDFEANSRMSDCVGQLRKDVESAAGLQVYPSVENVAEDMLMIESQGGVIFYQFTKGSVARYKEGEGKSSEHVWKISQGRIEWQIRHEKGEPVGIEVTTSIARKIAGKIRDRLKNSYVLFIGANNVMEVQL